MKIELTKEQYRKLIELLFLGNWIANATRTGVKGDEMRTDYQDIEKYILSFAGDFRAGDAVLKEEGEYFTTMQFEESLIPLIEGYDEYTFWEELADRLANRDLLKEIGPVRILKDEHMERKDTIEERYQEEFEKNGLRNLILSKPDNKKR
jgi:hypothetical protein